MLLFRKEQLPDDPNWLLELKLDGYRAVAFKTGGRVHLRSRNDNDFNGRYPDIVQALESMPDETVIDGEVVALDPDGRPSFNALQNYGGTGTPINYYVFDLLILRGRDVMAEPLVRRRELLEREVLPNLSEPVRYSRELPASLADLIQSVKAPRTETAAMSPVSARGPGRRCGSTRARSS